MARFNKKNISLTMLLLSITFSYMSLGWSAEQEGGIIESNYESLRECGIDKHQEFRGIAHISMQAWAELASEDGHLPIDVILVLRWFYNSQDEEPIFDFKQFDEWGEAIKYVLHGRKKKVSSYAYSITQRATHINSVSSSKTNVLRINAGVDRSNGIDFYASFDPSIGYVPNEPNEYSYLTCGLNFLTLERK